MFLSKKREAGLSPYGKGGVGGKPFDRQPDDPADSFAVWREHCGGVEIGLACWQWLAVAVAELAVFG